MSLTDFVDKNSRIYANDPTAALTDVVSIDATHINPLTPKTIIDDSASPVVVSLIGASRTANKNIKLMEGIGATITTIAGTVVLDTDNTEADLTYNTTYGKWSSNISGLMIPSTQKQRIIYSSGSVTSSAFLGFVDQGKKNSLALSANGEILGSGGPGFGLKAETAGNGVVWILKRDGYSWVETHRLTSNTITGDVRLGQAVTTNNSGTVMIAGAPKYTKGTIGTADYRKGALVVFDYQTNDIWKETATIIPVVPQISGQENYNEQLPVIGDMIKLSGDGRTLVIGIAVPDGTEEVFGYVWVYTRDTTASAWVLLQILDGQTYFGDGFGASLDISADSDTIVTGAPGYGGAYNTWDSTAEGAFITWTRTLNGSKQVSTVVCVDVSIALNGKYFIFEVPRTNLAQTATTYDTYYVWFWYNTTIPLVRTDPALSNATGLELIIDQAVVDEGNTAVGKHAVIARMVDLINNFLPAISVVATTTTLSDTITITNDVAAYTANIRDVDTGYTFATPTRGTSAGGYIDSVVSTVIGDTAGDQFGLDITLSAAGKTLALSTNNDVRVYSRTTGDWVLNTTQFESYFTSGVNTILSIDMNAAGTIIMVGLPNWFGNTDGRVFILTNTTGAWIIKAGPIKYLDTQPDAAHVPNDGLEFGSGVAISGSGSSAIIGARKARVVNFGVEFAYTIFMGNIEHATTPGVSPENIAWMPLVHNNYFVVESPVVAGKIYAIWFQYYVGDVAPDPVPEIGDLNPATYWRTLAVDIRNLTETNQATAFIELVITEMISAINLDSDFSEVITAQTDASAMTFKITFDDEVVLPAFAVRDGEDPARETQFTFTEIYEGEEPPITGAIWPFA